MVMLLTTTLKTDSCQVSRMRASIPSRAVAVNRVSSNASRTKLFTSLMAEKLSYRREYTFDSSCCTRSARSARFLM